MPTEFDREPASSSGVTPRGRPTPASLPRARAPRRWRDDLLGVALAFGLGAGAVFLYPLVAQLAATMVAPRSEVRISGLVRDPFPPAIPRFTLCWQAEQQDCVVDGDTLRFSGMTVRIADVDAPEVRDFRCPEEKALGERATTELLRLVNAGPFEVARYERDVDTYGRKLRILKRDGASIGGMLVAVGLARPWDGARHPWC